MSEKSHFFYTVMVLAIVLAAAGWWAAAGGSNGSVRSAVAGCAQAAGGAEMST
jgi:hypothetical protein